MSDLPRLLLCCFDVIPGPSAISRRLTEYVRGLSARLQTVVLTVKTPDHPHIERYHGARLLRVPVGAGDLAARVQAFDRAVRRQLESEDYVAVHAFDPFAGYALAERHAELGYKLVYDAGHFPSIELPLSPEGAEVNRRFIAKTRRQELFCLTNADAVIVGNPLTADWLCTLGVERELLHLVRAPVDLTRYAEAVAPPDAPVMTVVHLGGVKGGHGLPAALEAMALVSRPFTLKVIGPLGEKERAVITEQLARLGLSDRVELQEPVGHDDVHKVLATAGAGLLTLSDVERNRVVGSPLSRLGEYLAAGLPVIAADIASARQLVPEGAAVWYRPPDPASLAEALTALAEDPARRLAMRQAARAASTRWDGVKARADLVAIYASVAGLGSLRPVDEDEALADPNEVTQLGKGSGDDSSPRKEKRKLRDDSSPGTSKVRYAPPDTGTDSQPAPEPPPVMGTPLAMPFEPPSAPELPLPEVGGPTQPINLADLQHALGRLADGTPVVALPGERSPGGGPFPSMAADPADDLGIVLGQSLEERASPASSDGAVPPPVAASPAALQAQSASLDDAPDAAPPGSRGPLIAEPPFGPDASGPRPAEGTTIHGTSSVESSASGLHRVDGSAQRSTPPEPGPAGLHRADGAASTTTSPFESSPSGFHRADGAAPRTTPPGESSPPGLHRTERSTPRTASPGESSPSGLHRGDGAITRTTPPGESSPPGPYRTDAPPHRSAVETGAGFPPGSSPVPSSQQGAPSGVSRAEGGSPRPRAPELGGPRPSRTDGGATRTPIAEPGPSGLTRASRSSPRWPASEAASPPRASPSEPAPELRPPSSARTAGSKVPGRSAAPEAPGTVPAPGSRVDAALDGRRSPGVVPRLTGTVDVPPLAEEPSKVTRAPVPPPLPSERRTTGSPTPPPLPALTVTRTPGQPPAARAIPVVTAPRPEQAKVEKVDTGEADIPQEGDELVEVADAEVADLELPPLEDDPLLLAAIQTIDTEMMMLPSAIDPWLAQLVHGYCPPGAHLFDRHVPPTTMPGRDT